MTGSVLPSQDAIGVEDEFSWHPPGVTDCPALPHSFAPSLETSLDYWRRKELLQSSSLQAEFLVHLCLRIARKVMRGVHGLFELSRFFRLGLADEKNVPVWMGIEILHLFPAEDAAKVPEKDHDHGIIPVELSSVTLFA